MMVVEPNKGNVRRNIMANLQNVCRTLMFGRTLPLKWQFVFVVFITSRKIFNWENIREKTLTYLINHYCNEISFIAIA